MEEINAIALRDNAKYQLEQIRDVETGVEYLNKVKAIEVWAKAERKDAELQNLIAEQKIRTQRILGQLLKDAEVSKNVGNRYLDGQAIQPSKNLSDYGISKNESSKYQKIHNIPDDVFEETIEKVRKLNENRVELTTSLMLRVAEDWKNHQEKEKAELKDKHSDDIKKLESGILVICSRNDLALIRWAEERDLIVDCGDRSEWANPFTLKDGTLKEITDWYRIHYLPYKKSLLKKIDGLRGKCLVYDGDSNGIISVIFDYLQ